MSELKRIAIEALEKIRMEAQKYLFFEAHHGCNKIDGIADEALARIQAHETFDSGATS